MPDVSFLLLPAGIAAFTLAVFGSRGLLEIREALRLAEFDRLSAPEGWVAARALAAVLAAIPVAVVGVIATSRSGVVLLCTVSVAGFVYGWAPRGLLMARRRIERQVLDELALHLDLIALAMEAGGGWNSALASCVERAPDGPLRRAWHRVIIEMQSGVEPLEALRGLEQRLRLRPFATLVSAVRAAMKLQQPLAPVLRERARSAAAGTFARAEREARVAPLRLWAAMCLCLLPCTALVLAFPVARILAGIIG
jgi:tight adherence protein C